MTGRHRKPSKLALKAMAGRAFLALLAVTVLYLIYFLFKDLLT